MAMTNMQQRGPKLITLSPGTGDSMSAFGMHDPCLHGTCGVEKADKLGWEVPPIICLYSATDTGNAPGPRDWGRCQVFPDGKDSMVDSDTSTPLQKPKWIRASGSFLLSRGSDLSHSPE